MSVLARQRIRGVRVQITRPVLTRQADGSRTRVAAVDGTAPEPTIVQASAPVSLMALTEERRDHVFGTSSRATETIRVPLAWHVLAGDVVTIESGPEIGRRFRVEKTIAYRGRARLSHTECALVELPEGSR